MKKIFFAVSLFSAIHLTAQAEITQKHISPQTAQKALARFAPAYCHGGLDGFIKEIQACYEATNPNSAHIETCVAGDVALSISVLDSAHLPNHLSSYNKNYISETAFNRRIEAVAASAYFFGDRKNTSSSDRGVDLLYYIGDGLAPYISDNDPLKSLAQYCQK